MRYGLICDDLHNFADQLVIQNVDQHVCVPISMYVIEGLLMKHSNLIKIVAAASLLDPERAWEATADTRDAMF